MRKKHAKINGGKATVTGKIKWPKNQKQKLRSIKNRKNNNAIALNWQNKWRKSEKKKCQKNENGFIMENTQKRALEHILKNL